MSPKLNKILALWQQASQRARLALGAGLALLLLAALLGGYHAGRPNFVPLRAGLDDIQRAACEAALAEGGLSYEVSPFPGPYTVYVDKRALYRARNLVALSGAFAPAEVGIPSGSSSVSSVWQTTVERLQTARKREWQECEKQLQALDFVERATVTGSLGDSSPFAPEPAPTISVSLVLRHGVSPSPLLGRSVAKIVRFRFNTPPENVVIVDQHGRMLYDGTDLEEGGSRSDDLLELEKRYDLHKSSIANSGLMQMFGPGVAHVTVDSEWSYDRVESIRESLDPDNKVVVSESTTSSKTPVGGAGAQAGGSSGLAQEFGVENAASGRTSSGPPSMAQESGSERVVAVGRETRHQLSHAPTMRRMSIALAVDSTLADRLPDLERWVKAALHFDEERGDRFSSFSTAFAGLERDASGQPIPSSAPVPVESNPWIELALERGLELLAGIVFLVVLVKSLKGARAALARVESGPGRGAALETAVDAELLARARVEELIQSDPERVGEILSRWALEEEPVGAAR